MDDGCSPRFKEKGTRDRTSCFVTGLALGMVVALIFNNMLIGLAAGGLISIGIEAAARRGIRMSNNKSNTGTLGEN